MDKAGLYVTNDGSVAQCVGDVCLATAGLAYYEEVIGFADVVASGKLLYEAPVKYAPRFVVYIPSMRALGCSRAASLR